MTTVDSALEAVRIHTTTMERYVYIWSVDGMTVFLDSERIPPIREKMFMRDGDFEWSLSLSFVRCELHRGKCTCKDRNSKDVIRLEATLIKSLVSEKIAEGTFQVLDKHYRELCPNSACQALSKDDIIAMEIDLGKKTFLEVLPNTLKLKVEISVQVPVQKVTEVRPGTPMRLQRLEGLDKNLPILKNKEFFDTFIMVGDAVLPAHQCILAEASPVFFSMLQDNVKKIEITNFDIKVINIMLNFMYGRKAPVFFSFANQVVFKLFEAACVYRVDDLKELTEDYLTTKLNHSNVMDVLLLADMRSIKLKEKAIEYICKNKLHFSSVDQFKRLKGKEDLLTEILVKAFSS